LPALLRIPQGRGVVYWLAAPLEPLSWGRFLSLVSETAGLKSELSVLREGGGTAPELEYRVAAFEACHLAYFYNNSDQDLRLILQPGFTFTHIVDRRAEAPVPGARLILPARETAILEFR